MITHGFKIFFLVSLLLLAFLPIGTIFAQPIQCTDSVGVVCLPHKPQGTPGRFATFSELVVFILEIGLTAVGLVSVIFVMIGGYKYVTAGGAEDRIKSAKGMIFNALIGLVVVLLALAIVRITTSLLSGSV